MTSQRSSDEVCLMRGRRRSMVRRCATGLLLAGFLLCGMGCPPKKEPFQAISPQDAADLNAQRSAFDTAEDPKFTEETHYRAGQLAESQGAYSQALGHYRAALKLNSQHLPSLYRIASIYTLFKKYPEAVNAWTKYIVASKGDAAGYSNLGFCHYLAGSSAAAEAAFKKGLKQDPKHVACRVNYGLMLAGTGRLDEAITQLQMVCSPAEANYNVASVLEQRGEKDQARLYYQKALQLDPGLQSAKARLAAMDLPG